MKRVRPSRVVRVVVVVVLLLMATALIAWANIPPRYAFSSVFSFLLVVIGVSVWFLTGDSEAVGPTPHPLLKEAGLALAAEASDGLESGVPVQILIEGNPTWLAIVRLTVHPNGQFLQAMLHDESFIFFGRDAILGVRFGPDDD